MTPSQLRRLKGQLRREQERECIEAMLAFSRLPQIDAGAETEAGAEKGTSEALVASRSLPVPLLDAAYDRVAGACDKVVSLLLHPAYSYRCLCFMLVFARLGSSRDRSWDSLQAASKGVIMVLPQLVAAPPLELDFCRQSVVQSGERRDPPRERSLFRSLARRRQCGRRDSGQLGCRRVRRIRARRRRSAHTN